MPVKSRITILPDHMKSPAMDLFVPAFENVPYMKVLECCGELRSVAKTSEPLADDTHTASVTIAAKYHTVPYVPDMHTLPVHIDRAFSVEYFETTALGQHPEQSTVMMAAVYGLMKFRRTLEDGIKKDTYSYSVRRMQPPKLDRYHNRELYNRLVALTKAAKFLTDIDVGQPK